jgi:alpha-tubulin suppressor-like RCC1 family protein
MADSQYNTLIVGIDGGLSAMGAGNYGQLGLGSTTKQINPIKINTPTQIKKVVMGTNHSLILDINGSVSACGIGNVGQLGNGTTTANLSTYRFRKINLPPVADIACTVQTSYALGLDGTLSAWGRNEWGQLGISIKTPMVTRPIKLNVPPIRSFIS